MSSKDRILKKLRAASRPFTDVAPITTWQHMTPITDTSVAALKTRFIAEAEVLGCYVYPVSQADAIGKVCELIGADGQVLSWKPEYLSLAGLHDALSSAEIGIADPKNASVRVGITGVDAALAATGSLLLMSGAGKYRSTSLLPDLHVAIVRDNQIMPDLETWFSTQKGNELAAFRESSNVTIVSGPSKTADIGQELIKGAHGPREVHIILVE